MTGRIDSAPTYQTSIAGWSLALADALTESGFDAHAVFADAGLDLQQVTSPGDRLPVSAVQRVWQFADKHTDGSFGLRMSGHLKPGSLHALGFALWCSSSMKEFFERYIRYRCVLSHMHFCELIDQGDRCILSLVDERKIKSEITNDAASSFFVRMGREMGLANFAPCRVFITRPVGTERKALEGFFGAEVVAQSDGYRMEFARSDLESPLRCANPALASLQDSIVEHYIADHELISEYMLRVRTTIQDLLLGEDISLERTAERLHVSPRTLQRRLADEASSYNQLLDDVRKQLALEYVIAPKASATDIALRLGFSDTGSFGRCFKRWTGQSYSGYRRSRTRETAPPTLP